jgi:hypothetical protein
VHRGCRQAVARTRAVRWACSGHSLQSLRRAC